MCLEVSTLVDRPHRPLSGVRIASEPSDRECAADALLGRWVLMFRGSCRRGAHSGGLGCPRLLEDCSERWPVEDEEDKAYDDQDDLVNPKVGERYDLYRHRDTDEPPKWTRHPLVRHESPRKRDGEGEL